ncbi:MAG TPA: hypothetical protein VF518_16110 [Polyangia bacterium]
MLPGKGACGCGVTCAPAPDGGTSATSAAQLPECHWPAALDPTDAATAGQCRAARAFVTCQEENGGVLAGLMNDWPGCTDDCTDNEYGAACGAVGPSTTPMPDPPSGCRMVAPTPGGVVFYCCPCL